ncbi:threonine/serine exporter family protein [Bacillus sp. DTU_2020_1000418_1_SI_GHA_SEK_038]|uniref:threonine/serine exporter family protein n=1 Tax=Bacillus sp. DTU_2020_1000418_1_SI_GHA_SEK_038 TaxID=3077585 RepID=UPI0028E6ADFC|nr:threonine/serine exporter family protein [Bacillus sp. DTU_2020_1000418_1_SI_GHA_SEK_038]WNS73783.1 threonine/serine exporter family protein [Bacillus sp. DTU_2020_1000418_1_SI_GHA_SEK_038]
MENKFPQTLEVIDLCLLAGKIMLQCGGETYRVEDTMTRIAAALGIPHSHSYVVPTGIIFSIDGTEPAKLIRISERTTDLYKVTLVNGISRKISSGEMDIKEAFKKLNEIEKANFAFPIYQQILAASLSSGCFLLMYLGKWSDFLPAIISGGLGFICFIYIHRLVKIKFFSEFLAAFIIGLSAYFFVRTGIGTQLDKIIIGSVMPLVPGLLITNAIRDLMAGHLVAGLSKGAEAFLTACAIGTGVAVVIAFF